MKLLLSCALILSIVLALTLLGAVASFLYVVLFDGEWTAFLWTAGVSLGLIAAVKFIAFAKLKHEHQLILSAMQWELLGGATGWAWMLLALSSFAQFFWALLFGGSWRLFLTCLIASAVCKALTRYTMIWREATAFKQVLVKKGMSTAEARRAWIAEAQRRLRA
jgi:hypothetical protein